MFFDLILLNYQHKGRFGLAWVAATRGIQYISKKEVAGVNVAKLCDDISEYVCSQSDSRRGRFSLRLSAILINGTIKIYNQRVKILYDDLVKVLTAISKPPVVEEVVEFFVPGERPNALETPPSPIPKKRLKRKRDLTERSTPESEIERLIAAARADEFLFPPEEMAVVQAREEELMLRETQLTRQVAPIEELGEGFGAPLTEEELQEIAELVKATVPSGRQLSPIEEVSEPTETPRTSRRRETQSTPSEPEAGPAIINVQAQIHVSADVQPAPTEMQPSEGVSEAVLEREREVPTERPEIEKAVQEERPRPVLKEMQLEVVVQKDKKVAGRKKKKDDLSKILVCTKSSPIVRINRCNLEEVDWFDIDPCPPPECKLVSPNFTNLIKAYMVRGGGVPERPGIEPGLEDSASLRRKMGLKTLTKVSAEPRVVTPPVRERTVEGQKRVVPEISVSAPVPDATVTTPVAGEMVTTVTESELGPISEVEQRTIEEMLAIAAEERMESPRKRRRLVDVQPELSKDRAIPGDLPSREVTAEPFTVFGKETTESLSFPFTPDQARQQKIINKVCQEGKLTLEDVCQKPINRLNIARAFNDVLVLCKHEYVTLISEDDSSELKFIDKGPKISMG